MLSTAKSAGGRDTKFVVWPAAPVPEPEEHEHAKRERDTNTLEQRFLLR